MFIRAPKTFILLPIIQLLTNHPQRQDRLRPPVSAGVGTVVCIPTRERAMGNKTQPSSCLAAFILPSDCWVTFTNYILQCRICAVEKVEWEWKPKQTIWGSGGHVLKGAISQGLVNWWRVKDSPYYSRKGVHSAGTLRALKDLQITLMPGSAGRPRGQQCDSRLSGFAFEHKKAGLWAGGDLT